MARNYMYCIFYAVYDSFVIYHVLTLCYSAPLYQNGK